jgi:glycosyltransferase involved in cell wall biosynthesis
MMMNEPLNILMITHKGRFGSSARSHAMARQLVQHGYKVSIMLISPDRRFGFKEYESEGVKLIESPDLLWGRFRTGWDPWNTLNRIWYLNRDKSTYDLIHCFETRPSTIYPARFLSAKNRIPIITDWNDWWGHHGLIEVNRPNWYRLTFLGSIETYFEEAFRSEAAGLTVIASALQERAISLGVDPERICYIPGGAFIDKYLVRSKEECRRYANLPLENPILGFGSADSHLDMEIIMESLVLVAKKYPEVKLLITGKAKAEIYQMAAKYNLEDRIIFSGFLSAKDFPLYLGCADLFLLPMADRPYNHGRWPNKLGDYLSLGRPTISNPIGDVKCLFERRDVGLLAEWDAEKFAEKIIYLLDHPDLSEKIGRNARQVAENEYSWSILVRKLELFYDQILKEGNLMPDQTPNKHQEHHNQLGLRG